MQRPFLFFFFALFVALFAIGIPIEHKYDKVFRFFSLELIPKGVLLPPYFDQKIYFYISDLATIFLTAASLLWARISPSQFFLNKETLCLWGIFTCAMISIASSPLSSYPLLYIRLIQLLTPILLYAFLSQTFSEQEKSRITAVFFYALFIIASFEAMIAIAQYTKQSTLGLRLLGEVPQTSYFVHVNTNRWSLDYFFQRVGAISELIRPSGTLPHTNVLGGLLCASLLSSYSWIGKSKYKAMGALFFILQFFAMRLTYSRSAFFGWILGTFLWIALYIYHKKFKQISCDPILRYLFITISLSVAATTALLYEQFLSRGGTFNYNIHAKTSDSLRLCYQDIALKMIQSKPWTGVGFQQLTLRTPDYLPSGVDAAKFLSGPHNIYLFLAAETGLIALAAFLIFIVFLLKAALQTPFTLQLGSLLAVFAAFLFIGSCDFYLILFQQGKLLFFGFAGLLGAQIKFHKPFFARSHDSLLPP